MVKKFWIIAFIIIVIWGFYLAYQNGLLLFRGGTAEAGSSMTSSENLK